MAPGPIPWTSMKQFSDYRKFDEELSHFFFTVIRRLDNAYLEWVNKK